MSLNVVLPTGVTADTNSVVPGVREPLTVLGYTYGHRR